MNNKTIFYKGEKMAELGLVDSMLVKARSAQAGFEKFSQEQVDQVVKAIAAPEIIP